MVTRPLVGVLACGKTRANATTYSRVNDDVVARLARDADVDAVLLPVPGPADPAGLLRRVDGLVLPGSGSFVHPSRFDPTIAQVPGREYDPARDEAAVRLLTAADDDPDLPVLGSCRGMQEIAAYCGGKLVDAPGHRLQAPDRWGPAHPVSASGDGLFATLLPTPAHVNSQHTQVVTDLPTRIRVEARAPDGTVEAISVDWPQRFLVGIQWHFEKADGTTHDLRLLRAFGARCRQRMRGRN